MHVLFLHTSTEMCRDGRLWYYDEGLAITAGALVESGHAFAFRTIGATSTADELVDWIEERARSGRTLLVFLTSVHLSAYGHDGPDDPALVAEVRRRAGLPSAFIGNYATMNPALVLETTGVDAVGRGEMYSALVEYCDELDAGRTGADVAGFWVRTADGIVENDLRPVVRDLDALAMPRRDVVPASRMANEKGGILTVVASHGCPHDCSFCVHPVVRGLLPESAGYVRRKSPERVLAEIRSGLEALPGMRGVFFHDDIFATSSAWARDFLPRYATEIGLPFGCNLTVRRATPELARQLADAGCCQVQLGVESGSESIRNDVIRRGLRNDEIEAAVSAFHDAGIRVKLFGMMGVPGETPRDVRASIRAFARFGADMVQVQLWKGLTGSKLLEDDPNGGALWWEYQENAATRRVRTTRLLYGNFHRAVAVHRLLPELAERSPLTAFAVRRVVDWALLRPSIADRLARLGGARVVAALLSALAPEFRERVASLERELAAVHLGAARDTVEAPLIDARSALAAATG